MKKIYAFKILVLLPFLLGIGMLKAQVTIGAEIAPQPHSVLELFAEYETGIYGGLRLPQLSTTERDEIDLSTYSRSGSGTSAYGLMIYNLDNHCVEYWNSKKWVSLCSGQATFTFDGGIPNSPAFIAAGEDRGPFTPHDQPDCRLNPSYGFTVMSGTGFLHITVVDELTGQFYVTMDKNTTALTRSGIVRITNNCTLEYKDFLFTQDGATGLCIPSATAPQLASQNGTVICSGGAVILYLTGISNGAGYVWTHNGVEIIRDVNYYVAKQSGIYRVYAGAIGCEEPPSSSLSITNSPGNAPAPVSLIAVQNQGFVCSSSGTATIFATTPATGTIAWYKDGIKQIGSNTEIQAGIGTWFAMVEDGSCYSVPSNEIVVKLDPNAGGTPIPTPAFTVNGNSAGSTLQVCAGGMLFLAVTSPQPNITYTWYVNNELKGSGTSYELNMAGVSEDFILQCRAGNGNDCSTSGLSKISISLGNAPERPVLQSSTNGILCGGSTTLTTTSTADKYRWYKDNVLLAETTHPTNTYVVSGMGMYSLQVVDAQGCVSTMSTSLNVNQQSAPGTVTISPKPTQVDENQAVAFTATMTPEDATTTYTWTVGGATPSSTTGKTILVTFDGGSPFKADIRVVATNACTPGGAKDTVNGTAGITVKPDCQNAAIVDYDPVAKAATVIGAAGSTATLKVIPDGNSADFNYAWYKKPNTTTVLGTADTYAATSTGSYFCVVSPKCTGGNSDTSDDFEVTIMTITPTTVIQQFCVSTAITPIVFTTTGATGVTVSPALPSGLSGAYNTGAGTYTISGTTSSTASNNTYTLTLTNGTVSGVGTTIAIQVATKPSAPASLTSTANLCPGATATYSVTNNSNATYIWNLPATWSGSSTTNSIIVTAGTSGGTISVTAVVNGCASNSTTRDVTIFSQPNPVDVTICPGNTTTFTLAAATPGSPSYRWEESTDNSTWVNAQGTITGANYTTPALSANTVMYYRRVATTTINSVSCPIASNSAMVTVQNTPLCDGDYFTPNTWNYVDIVVNVNANGNGYPTPLTSTRTLRFLRYNLGADPYLTPKQQMAYNSCAEDVTVFGGLFQWGRKDPRHSFRCTDANRFTTTRISNLSLDDGKFIYSFNNWYTGSDPLLLWGNGNGIGTSGTPQQTNTTFSSPQNDENPCPYGYRVPTQHEWALILNEGTSSAGNSAGTTTGDTQNNPAGTIAVLGNTGIYWVRVRNGLASKELFSSTATKSLNTGYALYTKTEWEGANAAYKVNDANLCDAEAPEPLMYLPCAGYRNSPSVGSVVQVGTYGYYWSCVVGSTTDYSYILSLDDGSSSGTINTNTKYRALGNSVRCIQQ